MGFCAYPGCAEDDTKDVWCESHWGYFPHACEQPGCDRKVIYDDEPFCFTHSPDAGSSVRGYSAYKKTLPKDLEVDT